MLERNVGNVRIKRVNVEFHVKGVSSQRVFDALTNPRDCLVSFFLRNSGVDARGSVRDVFDDLFSGYPASRQAKNPLRQEAIVRQLDRGIGTKPFDSAL